MMGEQNWRVQARLRSTANALARFAEEGETGFFSLTVFSCTQQTAMYLYEQLRDDMTEISNRGGKVYHAGQEITFDEIAREVLTRFTSKAWDALTEDPEQAVFFLREKKRLGLLDDAGGDSKLVL